MLEEPPQPILVYDRIDQNRLTANVLLVLLILIWLPFVAFAIHYFGFVLLILLSHGLVPMDRLEPIIRRYPAQSLTVMLTIVWGILLLVLYWRYRSTSSYFLKVSGSRPVEKEQETELWRMVENLCLGAGLKPPRLFIVENLGANAFSTGLSPENSSLVVTRGLLQVLNRQELECVLAHELALIGNHEIRVNSVLAVLVWMMWLPYLFIFGIFRFLSRVHWLIGAGCGLGCLFYVGSMVLSLSMVWGLVGKAGEEFGINPLWIYLLLGLPIYCLVGAPLVAVFIKRGLLREHTFLNDADAVLLTRNPAGLATALKKISSAGNAKMKVHLPTAHLWIADPLSGWLDIFSSHPSLSERVDVLSRMSGGVSPEILSEAEKSGMQYAKRRKDSGLSGVSLDRIWGKGKGESSEFRVVQKSFFSDIFLVYENGSEITEMKVDFTLQKGEWSAQFSDFQVEAEGPGKFVLKSGGTVMARAEKIGLALSSLNVTFLNKPLSLKAHMQQLRFDILESDQKIGAVSFSGGFSQAVQADVPSGFPLALSIFILWLVLIGNKQ
jgi:heat shock protein HtpX